MAAITEGPTVPIWEVQVFVQRTTEMTLSYMVRADSRPQAEAIGSSIARTQLRTPEDREHLTIRELSPSRYLVTEAVANAIHG